MREEHSVREKEGRFGHFDVSGILETSKSHGEMKELFGRFRIIKT